MVVLRKLSYERIWAFFVYKLHNLMNCIENVWFLHSHHIAPSLFAKPHKCNISVKERSSFTEKISLRKKAEFPSTTTLSAFLIHSQEKDWGNVSCIEKKEIRSKLETSCYMYLGIDYVFRNRALHVLVIVNENIALFKFTEIVKHTVFCL